MNKSMRATNKPAEPVRYRQFKLLLAHLSAECMRARRTYVVFGDFNYGERSPEKPEDRA